MEANLVASLARGERIPRYSQLPKEGPPLEPLQSSKSQEAKSKKGSSGGGKNSRVRTISGMNEHLLAQLQQPLPLTRVASSPRGSVTAAVEGRPPLPRPPPSTLHNIGPYTPSGSTSSNVDAAGGVATQKPKQLFQSTNDDDNTLELSPEVDHNKRSAAVTDTDDAELQGEDLLDGAAADLEISDDDDSDSNNGPLQVTAAAMAAKPKTTAVVSNATPTRAAKVETKTSPTKARSSHIRRNTAGTVHVKGTMEKPDIDGTIHVVCGVIRAHIEQSLVNGTTTTGQSPNTVHVNLDVFRDDYECGSEPSRRRRNSGSMPSLEEIKAFYREFYQRSQMEFDAIIMSLIYVERLIKETNGAVMPTPDTWGSVVFSCMILASKVWDDLSMVRSTQRLLKTSSSFCV
jgi:hypothetical protein